MDRQTVNNAIDKIAKDWADGLKAIIERNADIFDFYGTTEEIMLEPWKGCLDQSLVSFEQVIRGEVDASAIFEESVSEIRELCFSTEQEDE